MRLIWHIYDIIIEKLSIFEKIMYLHVNKDYVKQSGSRDCHWGSRGMTVDEPSDAITWFKKRRYLISI